MLYIHLSLPILKMYMYVLCLDFLQVVQSSALTSGGVSLSRV